MSENFLRVADFWIGLGSIAATILIGLLAARVSYRVVRPSKRITVTIRRQGATINRFSPYHDRFPPHDLPQGQVYAHISIVNTGSRAVVSTDFHDGLPLELNLSTSVVRLDGVESRPDSLRTLPLCVDTVRAPNIVNAGPGLLNQAQSIEVFVTLSSFARLTLRGGLVDVKLVEWTSDGELRFFFLTFFPFFPGILGMSALLHGGAVYRQIISPGLSYWESVQFWKLPSDSYQFFDMYDKAPMAFTACMLGFFMLGVAVAINDMLEKKLQPLR